MVQLSPSRTKETLRPLGMAVEMDGGPGSPESDSSCSLTNLQLALNPSMTTYIGYEKYIEDGLICLKHKIRNIQKKKVCFSGAFVVFCVCVCVLVENKAFVSSSSDWKDTARG